MSRDRSGDCDICGALEHGSCDGCGRCETRCWCGCICDDACFDCDDACSKCPTCSGPGWSQRDGACPVVTKSAGGASEPGGER
jgi:hypothetical protein